MFNYTNPAASLASQVINNGGCEEEEERTVLPVIASGDQSASDVTRSPEVVKHPPQAWRPGGGSFL